MSRRRLLLLPLLGAAACSPPVTLPTPESAEADRPNFLIIDIDSLRADRLLAERDGESIAPTLASLARRSHRFTLAVSQAGWTLPAAFSLLSGRYPLLLDLRVNTHPLWDAGERSLPEILGYYGYRSVAFWGQTALAYTPLERGFDHTTVSVWMDYAVPLASWISEQEGHPFFAFVHNIDLHAAPLPTAELHRFTPAVPGCTDGKLLHEEYTGLAHRIGDAAARPHIIAHYDARLRYYDDRVAELLAQLASAGVDDRTVVVVLSDHGEELHERTNFSHATLYDTVLRIPLLISDPLTGSSEVDTMVQTIDLAPTILARAGVPGDQSMDGQSLLPLLGLGGDRYEERPVYSLVNNLNQSMRTRKYKVIRDADVEAGPERHEIYDLETDPGETTNAYTTTPDAHLLVAPLEHWRLQRVRATGLVPREQLDELERRDLQRRGYFELMAPPG